MSNLLFKISSRTSHNLFLGEKELKLREREFSGKDLYQLQTGFFILSMDHGVEVVRPIRLCLPKIAVGNKGLLRQDSTHLFETFLGHHPSYHHVTLITGAIMPNSGPKASNDPFLNEGSNPFYYLFFRNPQSFRQNLIRARTEGKTL
jgi:hypothetical protein